MTFVSDTFKLIINIILYHNMGMNCTEDPVNMGMFYIHNGYIFRPPTHTSGDFILESPPPPAPPPPGLETTDNMTGALVCAVPCRLAKK